MYIASLKIAMMFLDSCITIHFSVYHKISCQSEMSTDNLPSGSPGNHDVKILPGDQESYRYSFAFLNRNHEYRADSTDVSIFTCEP